MLSFGHVAGRCCPVLSQLFHSLSHYVNRSTKLEQESCSIKGNPSIFYYYFILLSYTYTSQSFPCHESPPPPENCARSWSLLKNDMKSTWAKHQNGVKACIRAFAGAERPDHCACRSGDRASKLQAAELARQQLEVQDAFCSSMKKAPPRESADWKHVMALQAGLHQELKQLLSPV